MFVDKGKKKQIEESLGKKDWGVGGGLQGEL